MNLSGKIGIWGFGKEGKSLFNHLQKLGGYNELAILLDDDAEDINVEAPIYKGAEALQLIQSGHFDLVFKSPGISLYRPEINQAKINDTKFSSATNLWFAENTKTKKIVLTGTKGKSTTASLLYHVMKEAGLSVSLGGNVGVPLLNLKQETDYTVLELSSYQLADLQHSPDVFVVLNLYPEHLQWHVTHKNYYNDKLRPLEFESPCEIIANAKNDILQEAIERTNKKIHWFNENDDRAVIETILKGAHNQDNIEAVLKACEGLGVDKEKALQAVKSFKPLLHRMQEFTSKAGLLCVNDSISTTPQSTQAALEAYPDRNKILIMGGTDRGQDYADLIEFMKNDTIKAVMLLPKNGKRLALELEQAGFEGGVKMCADLTEATNWIKSSADLKDMIILSPAAPSYVQFKNFEERGDSFIKLMSV